MLFEFKTQKKMLTFLYSAYKLTFFTFERLLSCILTEMSKRNSAELEYFFNIYDKQSN